MQKHRLCDFQRYYNAGVYVSSTSIKANTPRNPSRRLDPLYSRLNKLGLVTPPFKEVYWVNRRQAMLNLVQELALIQNLYDGSPLDIAPGGESLQTRAMGLNAHLINTAQFGKYSNSEKVNILYQLRRAVERLLRQYFSQDTGSVVTSDTTKY